MCVVCVCVCMYRLYNEDEGLSNIHDRGLVPECGGVSASYWFIQNCPM